jgi:hypothetical protein
VRAPARRPAPCSSSMPPPVLGSIYYLSTSTVNALLVRQGELVGYDVVVRGYTSAELRDPSVGGSSLRLLPLQNKKENAMLLGPGAFIVVLSALAPRGHQVSLPIYPAVGIASVSPNNPTSSMEVMLMAYSVSGGKYQAAVPEHLLRGAHPVGCTRRVRVIQRVRPFDPLAHGPWLRDRCGAMCRAATLSTCCYAAFHHVFAQQQRAYHAAAPTTTSAYH